MTAVGSSNAAVYPAGSRPRPAALPAAEEGQSDRGAGHRRAGYPSDFGMAAASDVDPGRGPIKLRANGSIFGRLESFGAHVSRSAAFAGWGGDRRAADDGTRQNHVFRLLGLIAP